MQRELTDAFIRTLSPPATGRLEIWDKRVRGLILRITAAGAFSWSVRTRTADGKNTRPKIGAYPALSLAEARKRAMATLADIQGGSDPVADRHTLQAARTARASQPTVAERLEEWMADKARDWAPRTAHNYRQLARHDIIPQLGHLPLAETTRADWASLVSTKRRTAPGVATTLYLVCSAFLGHAEAHGWIVAHPLPRKGLATLAPRLKSRERVLTDEELAAIWRAADAQPLKARAFTHLLILTGAREKEVADMATDEVDRKAGRWTIPSERAKNKRAITLPLSPLALAEIEAVWPEHGDRAGPGWRMLGQIPGSGRKNFSDLKVTLDRTSGVTAWRWHDLRRTMRTALTRLGVARDHAEAALNHVSSGLVQVYDRHDYAPEVLAAVSRWQAHVASLVTPAPSATVLPMRRARR